MIIKGIEYYFALFYGVFALLFILFVKRNKKKTKENIKLFLYLNHGFILHDFLII